MSNVVSVVLSALLLAEPAFAQTNVTTEHNDAARPHRLSLDAHLSVARQPSSGFRHTDVGSGTKQKRLGELFLSIRGNCLP